VPFRDRRISGRGFYFAKEVPMQVSNSTGQSTEYRVTGSGGANMQGGTGTTSASYFKGAEILDSGRIAPYGEQSCEIRVAEGCCVEFYVKERLVASQKLSCQPSQVVLMEREGRFWLEVQQAAVA
jgi:hypothetical protein